MTGGREKSRKEMKNKKNGRDSKMVQREERRRRLYTLVYTSYRYEREHKVLKPDPKMAVHKPSLQAKQKTVMALNK